MKQQLRIPLLIVAGALAAARAQDTGAKDSDMRHMDMKGMDMKGMDMSGMNMAANDPAGAFLMNLATGTSVNPESAPMPMIMPHLASWNTMLMGVGFLSDIQQSGPRGGDKLYSSNWIMAAAEHKIGSKGAFLGTLMLSLEPATVTERRYPLLFQTGETAFGRPIVDGQHPHNLIMGLGFHYAYELGESTTLDLYVAPVGDPALGPTAFPHRDSAGELPQAPISHHWQDSSHIVDEVVTVGVQHKKIKVEASGFHGAEPGENRWIIQTGAMDSWAARIWFFPTKNWAAQFSGGYLTHPEALEPGNQTRLTGSVSYSKPMNGSAWSSTVAWGRDHSTATQRNLNAYLVETVVPVRAKDFITGRVEVVAKDEFFADQPGLEAQIDRTYGSTFRVEAYTAGYTRDIATWGHVETGIGCNFTIYGLADALKPYYGARPVGGNMFLRFRLKP